MVPTQTGGMTATEKETEMILDVDPELILIDDELRSLREWGQRRQHELNLSELAYSIARDGQDTPAVVRETADGYVLVSGHRRHAAVLLLRQAGEGTERDTLLKVVVRDLDEDAAWNAAMRENVQREQFTGIEFAHAIKRTRARYHWAGMEGTEQLAELFCVSPATVTQAEKLLQLPDKVQDKVRSGHWSVTTALELIKGVEGKREEVAEVAEELAESEEREKREKKGKRAKKEAGKDGAGVGATGATAGAVVVTDAVTPTPPPTPATSRRESETDARNGEEDSVDQGGPYPERYLWRGVEGVALLGDETVPGTGPIPVPAPSILPPPPPPPAATTSAPVEARHVRKAQELVDGSRTKSPAPRTPEVAELFAGTFDTEEYPEVMRMFARAAVAWMHASKGAQKSAVIAAWVEVAGEVRAGTGKQSKPVKKPVTKLVKKPVKKPVKKLGTKPSKKAAPTKPPAAKKKRTAVTR